jgi:hypothetical protein
VNARGSVWRVSGNSLHYFYNSLVKLFQNTTRNKEGGARQEDRTIKVILGGRTLGGVTGTWSLLEANSFSVNYVSEIWSPWLFRRGSECSGIEVTSGLPALSG